MVADFVKSERSTPIRVPAMTHLKFEKIFKAPTKNVLQGFCGHTHIERAIKTWTVEIN